MIVLKENRKKKKKQKILVIKKEKTTKKETIGLRSDIYRLIFFKLSMMMDTFKLYGLRPVWMTFHLQWRSELNEKAEAAVLSFL